MTKCKTISVEFLKESHERIDSRIAGKSKIYR